MTTIIQWFTATDKGTLRKVNEDCVQIYPEQGDLIREPLMMPPGGRMCIVADGMGGHRGGQEASQTAVRRIAQYYYNQKGMAPDQALQAAVIQTGHDILAIGQSDPELQQMGTTVVAVAALDGHAYIVNVGDSRAYLLRNGQLVQLSVDDSWVQQQVRMQTITADQARTHLQRNLLIQFLGSKQAINPHLYPLQLQENDVFLLCTDGVFDVINQDAMIQMLSVPPHQIPYIPDQMIEQALLNGTSDNVTVAVGYYGHIIPSDPQGIASSTSYDHQRSSRRSFIGKQLSGSHILFGFIVIFLLGAILGFMWFIREQDTMPSATGQDVPLNLATSQPASSDGQSPDSERVSDGNDPAVHPPSTTTTLPLLTILRVEEPPSDEDDATAYKECDENGIIVSRQSTGTSSVELTIGSESISIPAGKIWHPKCEPLSDAITVTAGEQQKPVPNDGVQWIEYAEEVTIYGSVGGNELSEGEKGEKGALQKCNLSKPEDAAVIVTASSITATNTVTVTGEGIESTEYGTITIDNQGAAEIAKSADGTVACSMNAKVTTIALKDNPTTAITVTLQPRHYYVVRLNGSGQ